jgi:hypothetical protein
MKTKLQFLIIALFFGVAAMNAQPFTGTPVWLTGSGVGNWTEGGVIQLNSADGQTYTKTNFEIVADGQIKFTKGTWATAAGPDGLPTNTGFPSGVASDYTANSNNIVGDLGWWSVTYNIVTEAYTFTAGVNPHKIIGINGGGLVSNVLLTTPDDINYSKESVVFATGGPAKFVEEISAITPSPTADWSAVGFPGGTGTQGGALIPVPAGVYYVFFNILTGAYSFDPTTVSMIGAMNGWDDSSGLWDMLTDDGVNYYLNNVTIASGGDFKFRDNYSWNNNFGASAVAGIAAPDCCEVSNIPYSAGTYNITFNRVTLEYTFTSLNANIQLTGTNVAASPVNLGTTDGVNYSADRVIFSAGAGTGSINEVASILNPGPTFGSWPVAATPDGVLTPEGARRVLFNKSTGVYSFPYVNYGITGSMNGWGGNDNLTTTDGKLYTLANYVVAAPSDFKIRDNSWGNSNNYGDTVGPVPGLSGTALNEGTNFHLEAGTWNVSFNRETLAFSFTSALAVNKFETNKFSVYPNPTNNSWNFVSANSDISSVRIINVLGQTVMSKNTASKDVTVDASSLSKGMYFAKITSGDAVQTLKVIRN